MVVPDVPTHHFVIHDPDSIYSEGVDATLAAMGLTVLKTPVRAPQANAFCERLIGTIRRECLDFVMALSSWRGSCVHHSSMSVSRCISADAGDVVPLEEGAGSQHPVMNRPQEVTPVPTRNSVLVGTIAVAARR
jgi:hypothetical protein